MSRYDDAAARLALLNEPLKRNRVVNDETDVRTVNLTCSNGVHVTLNLNVNWGVGVGGGLWPAASLLLNQMASRVGFFRERMCGRRVLELGAGTGLLGLGAAHLTYPAEVVLTDLQSHVGILQQNAHANNPPRPESTSTTEGAVDRSSDCGDSNRGVKVRVESYDWGDSSSHLGGPFDVILGADLAYNPGLYAPLVRALDENSDEYTVTWLGITRSDTGIGFFRELERKGFEYYRVPDWETEGKSEAGQVSNFGMFTIFKKRPRY